MATENQEAVDHWKKYIQHFPLLIEAPIYTKHAVEVFHICTFLRSALDKKLTGHIRVPLALFPG